MTNSRLKWTLRQRWNKSRQLLYVLVGAGRLGHGLCSVRFNTCTGVLQYSVLESNCTLYSRVFSRCDAFLNIVLGVHELDNGLSTLCQSHTPVTHAFAPNTQESSKAEMQAESMKLIHSGKVLKDSDTIEGCGIKENAFLVVMVTKPKKAPVAAAVATTPAPAVAAPAAPSTPAPAPGPTSETDPTTTTPAPAPPADAPPPAPSRADADISPDMIANLTALGFPEAEVRHCLRAAQGNPDIAVEFLTHGIPPSIGESTTSATGGGGGEPLQALRNHPQFNDLRRLVQSNPAMLQQVLTQIGQQQPDLLREINANQAAFLQLMNEPISETSSSTSAAMSSSSPARTTGTSSSSQMQAAAAAADMMADPTQMAQMMQNMDAGQLQMMATMMGLSPEQVQAVGRMIGQLPPDQLQEYMAQAMGSGEGGGGGAQPQVLRLSEDEMAAVDRLTEMGFDRSEAAQAFLACDKNEALAANLLMDGGFGFGDADMGDDSGVGGDDDDDDMYS